MQYLKAHLIECLVNYFDKDYRRYDILTASVILHNVGIKVAEKIPGYNNDPMQEEYGPPEAKRILESLHFPEEKTGKVMDIIGNHHSRSRYTYCELAILKEADAIVNRKETNQEK